MVRIVFALILTFFYLTEVQASEGVVVYNRGSCSYFIVQTTMGYALLEWFGGGTALEGDIVVGEFERLGIKEIYVPNRGTTIKVFVEDHWLSKDRVIEKYREKCLR